MTHGVNRFWTGLSLAALIGVGACGGSSEADKDGDQILEIYSWWTNPGETDALDALLAVHRKEHPHVRVVNATVADIANAQTQLSSRMVSGNPPGTFQTMGGWDLWKWVAYNGQDDLASKMEPVDMLAAAGNWASVLPKHVVDSVSFNAKMYGVPVGIHRYNLLFFNKKVFADNGVEAPTTLAQLYQVGDVFKTKGIVPLALGSRQGWPLTQIAFDGLLIAQSGLTFRDSYLEGKEKADDARISAMLNETARLLEYTNADRDALTWDQAAAMVAEGSAAMTIMGDWAKGFFLSKGLRPDIELGQLPIPGTDGTFVYLVDSFGLPRGSSNREATVDFLNLVGSSRAQNAFNPIKGSTPPRTDADATLYDALAQKNIRDLQSNALTAGRQLKLKSPEFIGALDTAMRQFALDGKVDPMLNMLKNRYDLLQK